MNKPSFTKRIWPNIAGIIFVFIAMAAAAICRDGRLLGHSPLSSDSSATVENADGSITINTTELGADLTGYSGPVPVEITIRDGKIAAVTPLDNSETPGFFKRVTESGILDRWVGKTPQEALNIDVDAVTGATYSSTALIENVRMGLGDYVKQSPAPASAAPKGVSFYIALLVVLVAAVVPIFVKDKRYRTLQQLLNVSVLGFWAGTFVDYTLMLGIMSNGLASAASLVTVIMLIVAFIYPLFGRKNHYCAWVCPLGSLQELAGRCNPNHKPKLGAKTVKWLQRFRMLLWGALMLCLWCGWLASWIDYELFTAFMVNEAALGVVIAGGVFILLSVFVNRPYCRFVCPTGFLFHISENIETK